MTSFSAYLTVGSFTTWVNATTITLHQEADTLGRPASATYGGKLSVSFNTTSDPLITAWAFSPTKQWSGTLTYLKLDGSTLKVIAFSNAFCTDFREEFDSGDLSGYMITTLVISPEKVSIGGLTHNNNWPPTYAS